MNAMKTILISHQQHKTTLPETSAGSSLSLLNLISCSFRSNVRAATTTTAAAAVQPRRRQACITIDTEIGARARAVGVEVAPILAALYVRLVSHLGPPSAL